MHRGTSLVTETVDRIAAGDISPIEQQHVDESALQDRKSTRLNSSHRL